MSKTTDVRQQVWTAPLLAANTGVLAAQTLPTTGTTVLTTGFTTLANARTIRLKANQATVNGLVVVIAGTDSAGNVISENVTMGAFATATDTLNAFATITSITLPTRGAAGDTISFGPGAALGLDSFCDAYSFLGIGTGISSSTVSTTVLSRNTVVLSATLDGSTDQALLYVPAIFPTYSRTWG